MKGEVLAVHASPSHRFSKEMRDAITLIEGLGVEGDAHAGETVKHRSRVAADPSQPNLRQIHFIASELLEEVNALGFDVGLGALGENITTQGLDLISLPRGTRFTIGDAVVEITGLRNPCSQIETYRPGLLKHMIGKRADGKPLLRTGIMGVVLKGGIVRANDAIAVTLPGPPLVQLERV
ncbi:MOSC domain-containing protein [Pelagibacterium xiamenense]|uniref:MOSC domain-containing protein n=1 Tax=Pelagibacterium xiamenense TaxID=2901140 RepID=UPI001E3F24BF|nr:MOSC domain-containing protein [Pelagibacterium xiamenense]MCD7060472.1 MOSC domain-containing protein [Pelagibacterium xiamenense]